MWFLEWWPPRDSNVCACEHRYDHRSRKFDRLLKAHGSDRPQYSVQTCVFYNKCCEYIENSVFLNQLIESVRKCLNLYMMKFGWRVKRCEFIDRTVQWLENHTKYDEKTINIDSKYTLCLWTTRIVSFLGSPHPKSVLVNYQERPQNQMSRKSPHCLHQNVIFDRETIQM